MDILMLSRKGMSQRKIAKKLGVSRNTVKKYLENPEFPEIRERKRKRKSLLDPYGNNIKTWLEADLDYTAAWLSEFRDKFKAGVFAAKPFIKVLECSGIINARNGVPRRLHDHILHLVVG